MAVFTDEELSKIRKILKKSPRELSDQITYLTAVERYTETLRTDIRTSLDKWTDAIETDFVRVRPTNANYGVEIDAGDPKEAIRVEIGTGLEFSEYLSNSLGGLQFEILKG